jgi:hypothetical protein
VRNALQIRSWGHTRTHSCWRRVFKEWGQVQLDYWGNVPDDIGWWSSERANVSLLAHAIWRANGYSLQEYGDEKGRGVNRYRGRPDMYAFLRPHHYMIEAKQCWPRPRGKWQFKIKSSFAQAVKAADDNDRDDGCRAALTFASYIVPENHIHSAGDLVAAVLRQPLQPHKKTKSGFRVDLFPHGHWKSARKGRFDIRKHAEWSADGGKRYYVGVTLFAGFLD